MERIKLVHETLELWHVWHFRQEEKEIALERSIKHAAMLSVLKYVYTGKFERWAYLSNISFSLRI